MASFVQGDRPTYLQADRPLTVTTPLGQDDLLLVGFRGREAISRPFEFRLDLLAENATAIPFERLLGQKVTVHLAMLDGHAPALQRDLQERDRRGGATTPSPRSRCGSSPRSGSCPVGPRAGSSSRSPSRRSSSRCSPASTSSYELAGTYHPRDYCVQYRETDLDFAVRLMEEEGIYYFFRHSENGHTMVVADSPGSHPDLPDTTVVPFVRPERPGPRRTGGGRRGLDRGHLRRLRAGGARRGPDLLVGEGPGAPVGPVHPLGPLLRAPRQAPGGRGADHREGRGRPGRAQAPRRQQREAGDLRLSRRATPSGSTASTPAAATDRPTSSTSSRTTTGRSRSACRRRPPPALKIRGTGTCRQFVSGYKFALAKPLQRRRPVRDHRRRHDGEPRRATIARARARRSSSTRTRSPASPSTCRSAPRGGRPSRSSRGRRRPWWSARRARRSSPTSTAG